MPAVKKEQIQFFQDKLLEWYESNGRQFPWREEGLSEFQLIIAEILLQRTKAETVAKFYEKFLKDFQSWNSLVKADLERIEEYLKPIGLQKQRAKRLHDLAIDMKRRKGILPSERSELETIPLFGQYIVNAIELLIFDKKLPLIDVNMSRVLERYFGKRKMADIRYDPYLQKLAIKVVNHPQSKEINWAILDFGALICKSRKPLCTICLLKSNCKFFNSEIRY